MFRRPLHPSAPFSTPRLVPMLAAAVAFSETALDNLPTAAASMQDHAAMSMAAGAMVPFANARNSPDAPYARAFFVNTAVAVNAPAEALAVPRMGVHWLDTKWPELQGMIGNATGYKPFTATFIQGSWAGTFIFEEPMITRAHILAKKTATDPAVRDEVLPITSARKASPAGYYPNAYRITYDAAAKEYRIALTQFSYRA